MKKSFLLVAITLMTLSCLFPNNSKVVRITSERANIRQLASTDSPILLSVKKDTLLPLLGKSGNWLRVEMPDGQASGYVHTSIAIVEDSPTDTIAPKQQKTTAEATKASKSPRSDIKQTQSRNEKGPAPKTTNYKKFYLSGFYTLPQLEESKDITLLTTIYYETASFNTSYQAEKGKGFAATIGYRLSPAIAIEAGADITSRNLGIATTYVIPHPLWAGVSRSGEVSHNGKLTENAFFINLAYSLQLNPLSIQLAAGPCLIMAQADIIESFSYAESEYPYSSVAVTQNMIQQKQNVFGFNGSVGAAFQFGQSLAVIANVRYISAKMTLTGDGADQSYPSELTLGGLKFGAGLQISF